MLLKFLSDNNLIDQSNFKTFLKVIERNLDPVETIYNDLKTISFEEVKNSPKFLSLMN